MSSFAYSETSMIDEGTPLPKWMLLKFEEVVSRSVRKNLICIVRSYTIDDVKLRVPLGTIYAEDRNEVPRISIERQTRSEKEIILDERGYLARNIVRANPGSGTEDCILVSVSEYEDLKSDAENYRVIRERLSDEYIMELVKRIAKDT